MRPRLFASLLALLVCAGPALAQTDSVLDFVPSDALGFVLVNRIGQTDEQVTALARKMKTPLPDTALASLKKMLHVQQSLDEKGNALIVAVPGSEREPVMAAVVLPVTDSSQFMKEANANVAEPGTVEIKLADGKTAVGAGMGKFVVLAEKDHRAALDKVVKARQGKAVSLKTFGQDLTRNDLALVILPKGIELIAHEAGKGLDSVKGLDKQVVEILQGMSKLYGDLDKNVRHAFVGIRINDQDSLRITAHTPFIKGSEWSKLAANVKSPPGGVLAGLPGETPIAAFGMVLPKVARDLLIKMVREAMENSPLPAEQAKDLIAAMEIMYNFDAFGMALYPSAPGMPMFGENIVYATHASNSEKYLTGYEQALRQLLKSVGQVPNAPEIGIRRSKTENLPTLEISMPLPVGDDPNIKKVIGPGGKLAITMVAVDPHTVVATYAPPTAVAKLLRRIKGKTGSLTNQAQVKQLASTLPADPQFLLFLDPHRLSAQAAQFANAFPGGPNIPEFPKSGIVGLGAHVSPEGKRTEVVVPHAVLEHAPEYFQKLRQLALPGA